MPNVTTDLDKDSIYSYVLAVVKMGTTDTSSTIFRQTVLTPVKKINGADCLVVDVEKIKKRCQILFMRNKLNGKS